MAAITNIAITIGPKNEDDLSDTITISRDESKLWQAYNHQSKKVRGLFPSEIELAHMLQEHIVSKWSSKK